MRITTFKYTGDDFYPNYKEDLVKLYLMSLTSGDYRVSVWGADDCGYVKDFGTLIDAQNCYFQLVMLDEVNKDILESLGLQHF